MIIFINIATIQVFINDINTHNEYDNYEYNYYKFQYSLTYEIHNPDLCNRNI